MVLNPFLVVLDLLLHLIDRATQRRHDILRLAVADELVFVFRLRENLDRLEFVLEIDRHLDEVEAVEEVKELLGLLTDFRLMLFAQMPVSGRYFHLHRTPRGAAGVTGTDRDDTAE